MGFNSGFKGLTSIVLQAQSYRHQAKLNGQISITGKKGKKRPKT